MFYNEAFQRPWGWVRHSFFANGEMLLVEGYCYDWALFDLSRCSIHCNGVPFGLGWGFFSRFGLKPFLYVGVGSFSEVGSFPAPMFSSFLPSPRVFSGVVVGPRGVGLLVLLLLD